MTAFYFKFVRAPLSTRLASLLPLTNVELRFCAGLNPARDVLEILRWSESMTMLTSGNKAKTSFVGQPLRRNYSSSLLAFHHQLFENPNKLQLQVH